MSGLRPVDADRAVRLDPRCGSYASGHQVHAIRAGRAARFRDEVRLVADVEVSADGQVLVRLDDGTELVRFNHQPTLLARAVASATRIELRTHAVLAVALDEDLHRWVVVGLDDEPVELCESPSPSPGG